MLKAGKGGEGSGGRRLVDNGPATLDTGQLGHTDGSPGSVREVEVVASAAGAQVHDGSIDRLAAVLDLDLLSAPLVGGLAGHGVVGGSAPGRGSEGDVEVSGVHGLTAGTKSAIERVDGQVDAAEALASAGGARRLLLGRGGSGSGSRGSNGGSRGDGSRSVGSLSGCWRSWGRSRGSRGLDRLGSRRSGGDNDNSGGGSRSLDGRSVDAGRLLDGSVGRSRGSSRSGLGLGGLLVEVASGSGGGLSDGDFVVPDGGEDDYGLIGNLSLGDEIALEGGSSGHGAEKGGNENLGVLHVEGGEFADRAVGAG